MKLTGKFILSYLIISLLVIILGVVSLLNLKDMNDNTIEMYEDRTVPMNIITNLAHLMENTRVHMLMGIISEDPSRGTLALDNVEQVNTYLIDYENTYITNEEQEILNSINDNWNEVDQLVRSYNETIQNENYDDIFQALEAGDELFNIITNDLRDLTNLNESLSAQLYESNNNVYQSSRIEQFVVMIVATLLAIGIGIFIGRNIKIPISDLNTRLSEIANRNLSGELLSIRRKDEIGSLMDSTNTMQQQLTEIVTQVSETTNKVNSSSETLSQSADEVKQSSEQISSTMEELATGSEQQAHNAGGLSSGMNDFAIKIEQSAEIGQTTNQNAKNVLDLTGKGNELMNNSVSQMNTINNVVKDSVEKVSALDKETKEVSKLVSVIQDVADQTNLLALNASIEAARAGEAGKGFTVVAEEVRLLAEQTSSSVVEITNIIQNIQGKSTGVVHALEGGFKEVQTGTTQIQDTQRTFGDISDAVDNISNDIKTVTANLIDIRTTAQEMNGSVQEIASVSEESAAGIEETTSSAEESTSIMEEVAHNADDLAKLSENLKKMVQTFKI